MDSLPKGASLTPTFHLGNGLIFDEIEENTYLDDYTKEVLHEYNDADLFVDWLSPAQLVEAAESFSDTTYSEAHVYNAEEALEDALNTLIDTNDDLFSFCDDAYFIIYIGKNFGDKEHLFRTAKTTIRKAIKKQVPNGRIKIVVGIAHNPELTGECDLSIYAFPK